jgi:hypothetical protein
MTTTKCKTWATLKPNTPFASVFADGQVPIVSIVPGQPGGIGPLSYLVDPAFLSEEQIAALAEMLWESWYPKPANRDDAIGYIRNGLPLNVNWFQGATTTDYRAAISVLDSWADPSDPATWETVDEN